MPIKSIIKVLEIIGFVKIFKNLNIDQNYIVMKILKLFVR